jgi:histidine kinase
MQFLLRNFCKPNLHSEFVMRKYLLLALLFLRYTYPLYCQNPNRLLEKLPVLKGKERIDCLIEIAKIYNYKNGDSTIYYCKIMYEEATKIGYKKAIALSLLGLNPESESLRLQNISKAIRIGEELNDNEVLGWAYLVLNNVRNNQFATKIDRKDIIELLKKSAFHFQKAGDKLREAEVSNELCRECSEVGDEEGFEYCKRSIELSKQVLLSDKDWERWAFIVYLESLAGMSNLYDQAGDYVTAMSYLRQGHQATINKKGLQVNGLEDGMSLLFNKMGQYDSSIYYLQFFQPGFEPYVDNILGQTYFLKKNYEKAQQLFQKTIDSAKNHHWYWAEIEALLGLAKCFEIKRDYKSALKYAIEAYDFSKRFKFDERGSTMDAFEVLSRLYHKTGNNDSAYHYLEQYTILKDSANNKLYLWKLNRQLYEYKKQAEEEKNLGRINLLNKENQIKESKLKEQATLRNALIAGFVLFTLLSIFIFRSQSLKRKNERLRLQKEIELSESESKKKQAEFQQQATELEMQALRAQMNPHFIFNCLSSINRFIFKNETKAASDYLTRFSRLIRMVLMHSQKKFVPLEDELEMLRLYLDMERLRFKNAFDYSITTTNAIESTSVFIPPLLLQPFCENAIWHGLMHKEGRGHLNISITEENKILHCVIEDDGVGRTTAASLKSKSAEKDKSLGLQITAKRLALFNGEHSTDRFYEIDDVIGDNGEVAGTKVLLKIRYKENIEELV